ncbi:MAG: aminopeptidase [bacterium]|uniref:Aminopeptidase n=1 Tax=Fervidicoccus fontis TaxID=683846 RepID=A0A7C2ZD02_9CREN|nr:aminopeptidase [Fervidicoccus fontis]PMB76284.1 MAG: leucyl aminopeptidase [Fervidicoccus fontis]HEW63530.1 aminopeptidase [Fervidicoccus fontis]
MKEEYIKAAETAVKKCLGVKPGEKFLVITDTETKEIGESLFQVGIDVGAEAILTIMRPRTRHGEEPSQPIAEMWKTVDVFIAPTKYSLSHTQAREKATEKGARGATMPGITPEMFIETLSVDYNIIREHNRRMKMALSGKKNVRVITELGTDITLNIEGREIYTDDGILHEKGTFGNLPAGEVFVAPVEGTADGTIVVDGSFAAIGLLSEPIKITVKNGFATEIEGGSEAKKLKEMLASVDKKEAYNIAELGIGTNFNAKLVGNILEDEKVYKTVHLALGDNSTIGGKTKAGIHLDGLIKKPTLIVDGEILIEKGEWKI